MIYIVLFYLVLFGFSSSFFRFLCLCLFVCFTFVFCPFSAPEWSGQVFQRACQPAVRSHVYLPTKAEPATQRCLAQTGFPEDPPTSIPQPVQPEEHGLSQRAWPGHVWVRRRGKKGKRKRPECVGADRITMSMVWTDLAGAPTQPVTESQSGREKPVCRQLKSRSTASTSFSRISVFVDTVKQSQRSRHFWLLRKHAATAWHTDCFQRETQKTIVLYLTLYFFLGCITRTYKELFLDTKGFGCRGVLNGAGPHWHSHLSNDIMMKLLDMEEFLLQSIYLFCIGERVSQNILTN